MEGVIKIGELKEVVERADSVLLDIDGKKFYFKEPLLVLLDLLNWAHNILTEDIAALKETVEKLAKKF